MAYYLVRAKPRAARLQELEDQLRVQAFVELEPFGRALTKGLRNARVEPTGAVWEEEDYCQPPLAEERAAVLDAYFDDLTVEPVAKDGGCQRIAALPRRFPGLDDRS